MKDLLIIGAGPYGISLAAYAEAHNLSYTLLGYPMHFWKHQMPQDMFIRTNPESIYLSDEKEEYTLQRFAEVSGTQLTIPLPRPIFVHYAMWFAAQTNVEFTPELVQLLQQSPGGYTVTTERGAVYSARNAIIATGLQHYPYIPDIYEGLPSSLVSHTFGITDFSSFSGKKVAVIGSGQSAWEAAALLHRAGSAAELIYRRETANYREGNSGAELIRLGETFYELPLEKKQEHRAKKPGSAAAFLRPYVEGTVRETGGVRVEQAVHTADNKLLLQLSNGDERLFDHLITASGYRVHLERVPFLHPQLFEKIDREEDNRFPLLDAHFESSLPGLYFVGPLAAYSHGPACGFIAGLGKACRSIIPRISGKRAAAR